MMIRQIKESTEEGFARLPLWPCHASHIFTMTNHDASLDFHKPLEHCRGPRAEEGNTQGWFQELLEAGTLFSEGICRGIAYVVKLINIICGEEVGPLFFEVRCSLPNKQLALATLKMCTNVVPEV